MSEKVRVMFEVPSDLMTSKLRTPVEIPEDDYVRIRMAEHNGDKEEMADYVMKHFLKKGASLSGADVSMSTAVGNPFYIMLVDQAIEEGKNPYEAMKENRDDEDDDSDDSDSYGNSYRGGTEGKLSKKKTLLIVCGIVGIMLIFFIAGMCSEPDTRTQEEKYEEIEDNAGKVWNNIKDLGGNHEE